MRQHCAVSHDWTFVGAWQCFTYQLFWQRANFVFVLWRSHDKSQKGGGVLSSVSLSLSGSMPVPLTVTVTDCDTDYACLCDAMIIELLLQKANKLRSCYLVIFSVNNITDKTT